MPKDVLKAPDVLWRWKPEFGSSDPEWRMELRDIPGRIEMVGAKRGRVVRLERYPTKDAPADLEVIIPSDIFDEMVVAYFTGREPMETMKALIQAGRK
jgi:hypothetical protein